MGTHLRLSATNHSIYRLCTNCCQELRRKREGSRGNEGTPVWFYSVKSEISICLSLTTSAGLCIVDFIKNVPFFVTVLKK